MFLSDSVNKEREVLRQEYIVFNILTYLEIGLFLEDLLEREYFGTESGGLVIKVAGGKTMFISQSTVGGHPIRGQVQQLLFGH